MGLFKSKKKETLEKIEQIKEDYWAEFYPHLYYKDYDAYKKGLNEKIEQELNIKTDANPIPKSY